jgi:hypothetical protein
MTTQTATQTDWTAWNPWAPYADYDAYYAAKFAIAQVLGFEVGAEATEAAKTYGQSTVYTGLVTGAQWIVKWDPEAGATIHKIN